MTIKKQILILLISFSIIPTLALTVIRLSTTSKTIESLHLDRLNSITRSSVNAFNQIIKLKQNEIMIVANGRDMKDYIVALEQNQNGEQLESAKKRLGDYCSALVNISTFEDYIITDERGNVVLSNNADAIGMDLSKKDYFQNAINQSQTESIFISNVQESPITSGLKIIAFSKIICDSNNKPIGTFIANMNINVLAELFQSITFGKTGIAFIIDTNNYILYHPEIRFLNSYTSAPQLAHLHQKWENGEIESNGKIEDIMDGKRRIYYYEVIVESGFIVILRQDYDEFASDRNAEMLKSVISCCILLVVSALVSIKLSHHFVKPINKLKEAFSSGNIEGEYVLCEITGKNELGDMAQSYNNMISKLEQQYEMVNDEKIKNQHNASHDIITGLPNLQSFERDLEQLILDNVPFAVLYLQLDDFKKINYRFGHISGDEILNIVAKRISALDELFLNFAAIGGGDFVLCKEGCEKDIKIAVQTLSDEIRKNVKIEGTVITLDCNIGVSFFPDHALSIEALVANADMAMYDSSKNSVNSYKIYNPNMRIQLEREKRISNLLKNCIRNKELFFMYQPIFNIKNQEIIGVELLSRIRCQKFGLLSPVEFIPIAEKAPDTIAKIETFAFENACKLLQNAKDAGNFDGFVSINVSMISLKQETFVTNILKILSDYEFESHNIHLEINEKSITSASECVTKNMKKLQEAGVSIVLDNFGGNTCSLFPLVNTKIATVKLNFEQINSPESQNIYKNIVELIKNLDVGIIATCVETDEMARTMQNIGCNIMQGFLHSRPLTEEKIMQKIASTESNPAK